MTVALIVPFVVGCGGASDSPTCTETYYADSDTDGHGDPDTTVTACSAPASYVAIADDCDDADASVKPGAIEVCNGIDDDCDHAIDDGDASPPTWYADLDADGHGDPAVSIAACEAAAGYVATSDDCDDTNSAIHGGADELCDGLDNDCDVEVDENLPAGTWYRDADGDGHGNPDASLTEGCAPPSGYVATADDCDDLHVHAYDDAPESLTDGVDDACDGVISITPAEELPLWKASGAINSELGVSIAFPGDFNGDGVPDVALGGSSIEVAKDTWRSSMVLVFSGPFEVTDTFVDDSSAAAVLYGTSKDSQSAVVSTGDIDEDGADDLLICAPWRISPSYAGRAYVVWGPVSGLVDLTVGQTYEGDELYSGMCAGPGDVDGDGVADLVIGAPWAENGGFGRGSAYVLSGPAEENTLQDAGQILSGTLDVELIGDDVVALDDVDGDGLRDFSVSNAAAASSETPDGTAVYLVTDHSTGSYHPRDVGVTVFDLDGPHDGFIVSRMDDINGDGYNDVGFAENGYDVADLIEVIEGPFGSEATVSLVDEADVSIWSSESHGIRWLAWATPLGNWNGDGSGALAIADPGMTSAEADGSACGPAYTGCMQGAVYVMAEPLYEGWHDLAYEADRLDGNYVGGHLGGGFGAGVQGGSDLNGDEIPDLVFAAYGAAVAGVPDAGAAYILFGGGTP